MPSSRPPSLGIPLETCSHSVSDGTECHVRIARDKRASRKHRAVASAAFTVVRQRFPRLTLSRFCPGLSRLVSRLCPRMRGAMLGGLAGASMSGSKPDC
jgi:hypothetical protein